MDPSKLLRASKDGKVEWNTTRCILPVTYRRICNGNPGLRLAVFFKAWDKYIYTCIHICIHICKHNILSITTTGFTQKTDMIMTKYLDQKIEFHA